MPCGPCLKTSIIIFLCYFRILFRKRSQLERQALYSFILDKVLTRRKKQKKSIKNQRNKGLQVKTINDKFWEFRNQNI